MSKVIGSRSLRFILLIILAVLGYSLAFTSVGTRTRSRVRLQKRGYASAHGSRIKLRRHVERRSDFSMVAQMPPVKNDLPVHEQHCHGVVLFV